MNEDMGLVPVAIFCGNCDCGCPAVAVDPSAPVEQRVVVTDDFGQRVQMSAEQLRDLIEQARAGSLDQALSAALG
ncbi:MAG TPA: hypothetical protein VGS97_27390 [Actinocrinis sp.]|uniref:hypothetical protein n=1 Tax=Actinocrinis sp. TaxID=1920516 RepID=UPI002DDD94D3|nr:hypothetical protein [Actinocrinis sp.]HEV2347843.1 hypothetical protein [Actinocrinis sp.]